MATLENRIAALEQHSGKNPVNVFIRRFADEPPIIRAAHGGMNWEKRLDESQGEFEERAVRDAQKLPCDGAARVFELWDPN